MRSEFFNESKFDSSKQRYGLFSFTGTLAISKTEYEQKRASRRDADGAVQLAPRNFTSCPTRKGKGNDAYFSAPTFVSIGDPYKDAVRP